MAILTPRVLRIVGMVLGVLALIVVGLVGYVEATWSRPLDRSVVGLAASRDPAQVRRGQHLYERTLLCWNCHGSQGGHNPAEPQAGGREFDLTKIGPGFGYVYGTNLTSDAATGIGAWSDGEIVRAIREGVSRDGRLIFPVMAYQFYHGLSDQDALAVVAYLRTLPPVRNAVPAHRMSFAAKALEAFGLIKAEPPITRPVEAPRAAVTREYGEYLTWRASGCAECHSPRDPGNGRLDPSRPLAGGLFALSEEGFTTTGSNLTPDAATGIGGWTEEQFVTAVQTGVRPNGTVMVPFMPWPSYGQWSRDDLRAVWLYLRSLKPIAHSVPATSLTGAAASGTGATRGKALYGAYCLTCHGANGGGSPFTTMAIKDAVGGLDDNAFHRFVAEGLPGTAMPGFGKTLTRDQISDVLAYTRSW